MKELTSYLKGQLSHNGTSKKKLFIPYLALNDPDWNLSFEIIQALFDLGADTIELGLPFTDPTADGPVLQSSFKRILEKEFKLSHFFDFIGKVHQKYPQKPLLVMGYANLFYRYGFSKFFQKVKSLGVQGLVIPDIPYEEKQNNFELEKTNLSLIDFVTPTTKEEKIKKICPQAEGFLYLVAAKGVTGGSSLDKKIKMLAQKIKKCTDIPVVVGFGVRTKEQVEWLSEFADGFIIGSLIHELIEQNMDHKSKIPQKIEKVLGGILEGL